MTPPEKAYENETGTGGSKGKIDRPLAVAIFLGTILAMSSIPSSAEPIPLSPECESIRIETMRAYWRGYSDTVLGARMTEILRTSTGLEMKLLMLGEVLSGRVSANQLGESLLAGYDAIGSSPSCNEVDRKSAEQLRTDLPKDVSALEDRAAEMRKGP
jgi:hypothetical protein